jgi:hypothetical protein
VGITVCLERQLGRLESRLADRRTVDCVREEDNGVLGGFAVSETLGVLFGLLFNFIFEQKAAKFARRKHAVDAF